LVALLAAVAAIALIVPAASQAGKQTHKVSVMTRNLDLGADLQPVTQVSSFAELKDAAGVIVNEVDANKFPVRAKGLASEILKKDPDLVGLQEVPLFRDAPCSHPFLPPQASHVRYDYLKLLMKQLNKGKRRYRVVISHTLTDFEAPANTDGSPDHSCEINGRYTDRDAILARRGVQTSRANAGTFSTLLVARLGGFDIPQLRGWTRVNAKVKGAPRFRFVNTHLEAFDNQKSNHTNQGTDVKNGRVREAQAKELIAKGGPATGNKPVVLAGDLNSDVKTPLKPGDGLAHRALLKAGWRERSTSDPLSCCLKGDTLAVGHGAHRSQFDHKVDHVMTDSPKQIKLIDSSVTGRQPVNGFWDSDHAGVFSTLKFRAND
jgi:endonuclease/exonuclease/phosphatase family metal-dependent hydrolase